MSQGVIQTLIATNVGLVIATATYMLTRPGHIDFRFTVVSPVSEEYNSDAKINVGIRKSLKVYISNMGTGPRI